MLRRVPVVALVASLVAVLVTGCGNAGSSAFVPGGGATASGSAAASMSASAPASPAPAGLKSFTFPASVHVEFQTPLPSGGASQAAVIGYENYVNALWYAVLTHGTSKAYRSYASGNALDFVTTLIAQYRAGGYTLRGTIIYYDTSVPSTYYGAGAVVESCVNASGLTKVVAATGRVAGPVFSAKFGHYQEQASAGKKPDGTWWIGHTANYPAASGGTAGVCG